MAATRSAASHAARRRWAGLLAASLAAHTVVLGVWATRQPAGPALATRAEIPVSLAPAPFARAQAAPASPHPLAARSRVVRVADVAPRLAASAQAPTGQASEAVDLFGPVFADGLWPRPVRVASVACDPDRADRDPDCRRDLMLIGLASQPPSRSKAAP